MLEISVMEKVAKDVLQAVLLLEDASQNIGQPVFQNIKNSDVLFSDVKDRLESSSLSLQEASKSVEQALAYLKSDQNSLKCSQFEEKYENEETIEMKVEHSDSDEDKMFEPSENISEDDTKVNKKDIKHECSECQSIFKSQANLQVHMSNIHKADKSSCDICGFLSANLKALKRHKKVKHLKDHQNPIICDICNTSFKGPTYLKVHKENVHNSTKVACELCGFLSSNSSALSRHIKFKHSTNDRVFLQCDKCEFSHWNKYTLESHIQSKHGDTKFRCDTCHFESTSKQALGHHKRKIHSEKRYQCNRCNYSCLFESILKTHISSVHEGIRFSCDICHYTSAHKGDLKVHKRVVHEGFRVNCSVCEFSTTKQYKLKVHMRNKHKGDYVQNLEKS